MPGATPPVIATTPSQAEVMRTRPGAAGPGIAAPSSIAAPAGTPPIRMRLAQPRQPAPTGAVLAGAVEASEQATVPAAPSPLTPPPETVYGTAPLDQQRRAEADLAERQREVVRYSRARFPDRTKNLTDEQIVARVPDALLPTIEPGRIRGLIDQSWSQPPEPDTAEAMRQQRRETTGLVADEMSQMPPRAVAAARVLEAQGDQRGPARIYGATRPTARPMETMLDREIGAVTSLPPPLPPGAQTIMERAVTAPIRAVAGMVGGLYGGTDAFLELLGAGDTRPARGAQRLAKAFSDFAAGLYPSNATFVDDVAGGLVSTAPLWLTGWGAALGASRAAAWAGLSPVAVGRIASWTGSGASAVGESWQQVGDVFTGLVAKGMSRSEAANRALWSFARNLALLWVTNKASGLYEGGRHGILRSAVRAAPMEGVQEGGQEIERAYAEGRPVLSMKTLGGVGYNAAIGAAVGAIFGAARGGMTRVQERQAWSAIRRGDQAGDDPYVQVGRILYEAGAVKAEGDIRSVFQEIDAIGQGTRTPEAYQDGLRRLLVRRLGASDPAPVGEPAQPEITAATTPAPVAPVAPVSRVVGPSPDVAEIIRRVLGAERTGVAPVAPPATLSRATGEAPRVWGETLPVVPEPVPVAPVPPTRPSVRGAQPESPSPVAAAPPTRPVAPVEPVAPPVQAISRETPSAVVPAGQRTAPKPEYASTQLDLPADLGAEILAVGRTLPEDALAEDGVEDTPHVTVQFGLHDHAPASVRTALANAGPVPVTLGAIVRFTDDPKQDVLVVQADSPELRRLREAVRGSGDVTDTHPEYRPHVTLAYVKKGAASELDGDTRFAGQTFTAETLTFSPPGEATSTAIPLARAPSPLSATPEPTGLEAERDRLRAENERLRGQVLRRIAKGQRGAEPYMDVEDIDTLARFVRDRGGIAPDPNGVLAGEYQNVPARFRHRRGLTPDRMAEAVNEHFGSNLADHDILDRLGRYAVLHQDKAARHRAAEYAAIREWMDEHPTDEAVAGRAGLTPEEIRRDVEANPLNQPAAAAFIDGIWAPEGSDAHRRALDIQDATEETVDAAGGIAEAKRDAVAWPENRRIETPGRRGVPAVLLTRDDMVAVLDALYPDVDPAPARGVEEGGQTDAARDPFADPFTAPAGAAPEGRAPGPEVAERSVAAARPPGPAGRAAGAEPAAGPEQVAPAPDRAAADEAIRDLRRELLGEAEPEADQVRAPEAAYRRGLSAEAMRALRVLGAHHYLRATDFESWRRAMQTDLGDVAPAVDAALRGVYDQIAEEARRARPVAPAEGSARPPEAVEPGRPTPAPRTVEQPARPTAGPRARPDLGGAGVGGLGGAVVVVAREEHTARVDAERILPARLLGPLTDFQRQGAAKALLAMDIEGAGFLLADGTGTGKSWTEMAIAGTWLERGNPVVLVTKAEVIKLRAVKGRQVPSGSLVEAAEGLGVPIRVWTSSGLTESYLRPDAVTLTTYEKMAQMPMGGHTVVIFDESHALKNETSGRARVGADMIGTARAVLFASATPADKPTHLDYLARAGVFEGKSPKQVYEDLGYIEVTRRVRGRYGPMDIRVWEPRPGTSATEINRRMEALFDRVTGRGLMVTRSISLDGVAVEFETVPLPQEALDAMRRIEDGFGGLSPNTPPLLKARILMHQRRQQEPYKIEYAVDRARRSLDAGRQVVLFVSRVNFSEAARKFKVYDAYGNVVDERKEVYAESEGTAKSLRAAFARAGITDLAELHGAADTKATEAMAAFQSGRARIMIATIESGGTGINLDDRTGTAPRDLVIVTAPFSAVENVQAAGRVWRLTSRSQPRIVYLGTSHPIDAWNLGITARKLQTLGAVVSGDVTRLQPEESLPGKVREPVAPYGPASAPARWLGWQERPNGAPLQLWNLTEQVGEHPAGDTVTDAFLRDQGFEVPDPPEPMPRAPIEERTKVGRQTLVPGAEARRIPTGRLRPRRQQKAVDETPLFGQTRAEQDRQVLESQGTLFAPDEPGLAIDPHRPRKPAIDALFDMMLVQGEGGESRARAQLDPRLLRVLGGNLYSGDLGVIAVKEMVQNAVDAVRGLERPDLGVITVDYQAATKEFTVIDTGTGMTPAVAANELVDPGGSLKPEGSSGGFGIAKVAIFANAAEIEAVTVARDKDGALVTTRITGSGEDWIKLDTGLRLETAPGGSPAVEGTGTALRIRLNPTTQAERMYVEEWLIRLVQFWRLPMTLVARVDGVVLHPKDRTLTPTANFDVPGARVELLAISGVEEQERQGVNLRVLNNGLPQFLTSLYFGGHPVRLPHTWVIDVHPNSGPDAPNYPFRPDREGLREEALNGIERWMQTNLVAAAAARDRDRLVAALDNAPRMRVAQDYRVLDTTGKLSAWLTNEIAKTEVFVDLVPALDDTLRSFDKAQNPEGQESGGGVRFLGVSLAPDHLALNINLRSVYGHGAFQKHPEFGGMSTGRAGGVFVNPYTMIAEVEKALDDGIITDREGPEMLAQLMVTGVLHEVTHQKVSGHDEGYAGELTRLGARTIRAQALALDTIQDILEANDGTVYRTLRGQYNESLRQAYRQVTEGGLFGKVSDQLGPAEPRGDPGRAARGEVDRPGPSASLPAGALGQAVDLPRAAEPGERVASRVDAELTGRPAEAPSNPFAERARRARDRYDRLVQPTERVEVPRVAAQRILTEGQAFFAPRAQYAVRPGTTPAQRQAAEDFRADLVQHPPQDVKAFKGRIPNERLVLDGPQARTIALAIPQEYARTGGFHFVGREARTAEAFARLAQPVRDPRVELFWRAWTVDGRGVAEEIFTSREAGSAATFLRAAEVAREYRRAPAELAEGLTERNRQAIRRELHEIRERRRRIAEREGVPIERVRYTLGHNHPSGSPRPSRDDIATTRLHALGDPARGIKGVDGFDGHVITDSETYAVITPAHLAEVYADGTTAVHLGIEVLPLEGVGDPFRAAARPHPALHQETMDPRHVIALSRRVEAPDDHVVLFYRNSSGHVQAIGVMSVDHFLQAKPTVEYLRGRRRDFGAVQVISFYPQDRPRSGAVQEAADRLIAGNALLDHVDGKVSTIATRSRPRIDPGSRQRADFYEPNDGVNRGIRVRQDEVPYGARPTDAAMRSTARFVYDESPDRATWEREMVRLFGEEARPELSAIYEDLARAGQPAESPDISRAARAERGADELRRSEEPGDLAMRTAPPAPAGPAPTVPLPTPTAPLGAPGSGAAAPAPAGPPLTAQERATLMRRMEETLRVPMRVGRIPRRRGIFKARPPVHVIRTRVAHDMRVLAHEMGHAMARRLLGPMGGATRRNFYRHHDAALMVLAQAHDRPTREEGFAEFWWHWVNDHAALERAHPTLTAEVEALAAGAEPEVWSAFQDLRAWHDRFKSADPVDRIKAHVMWGGRPKAAEPIRVQWQRFLRSWVDNLAPARAARDRLVEGLDTGRRTLAVDKDFAKLMQSLRGTSPVAEFFLFRQPSPGLLPASWRGAHGGAISFDTRRRVGPALDEILEPVAADLQNFGTYLIARRMKELGDRRAELTAQAHAAKRALSAAEESAIRRAEAQIEALSAAMELRPGDADRALNTLRSLEFDHAHDQLQEWNESLIRYMEDSTLLTRDEAQRMLDMNRSYVPFYRVFEEFDEAATGAGQRVSGVGSPAKMMKGSGRLFDDPFHGFIKNAYIYVQAAERHHAMRQLVRLAARSQDSGSVIEPVPAGQKQTTFALDEIRRTLLVAGIPEDIVDAADLSLIATVYRPDAFRVGRNEIWVKGDDGKPKHYIVKDSLLYELLASVDRTDANMLEQMINSVPTAALRGLVRFLTTGIPQFQRYGVTLGPEYVPRNWLRDSFMRAAYTQTPSRVPLAGPFVDVARSYVNGLRGIFSALTQDEAFDAFVRGSGAISTSPSLDTRDIEAALDDVIRGRRQAAGRLLHPLTLAKLITQTGEEAGRVAESRQVIEARGQTPGRASRGALMEGGHAARDLQDFRLAGAMMRAWGLTRMAAFSAGNITGLAKFFREMRRRPGHLLYFSLLAVTLPTLINWWWNHDDPRWAEVPQWQKDFSWVILDGHVTREQWDTMSHEEQVDLMGRSVWRMPKPWELGVLFGSVPERILDYAYGHTDKSLPAALGQTLLAFFGSSLMPTPTFLVPLVQNFGNWTWFFDRPVETESMRRLPPEKRTTPGITPTTAEWIAQGTSRFSETTGVWVPEQFRSPAAVDNLMRSWTGGTGRIANEMIDWGVRAATEGPEPAAKTWMEAPVIRGFTMKPLTQSAESVRTFYEAFAKNQEIAAAAKLEEKREKQTPKWSTEKITKARPQKMDVKKVVTGYAQAHALDLMIAPAMKATADQIAAYRQEIGVVLNDRGLTPEEKAWRRDDLTLQIIGEARLAVDGYRDWMATGGAGLTAPKRFGIVP